MMLYPKNRILRVLRKYNIYDRRLGIPVMNGRVANEILKILGEIKTVDVCKNGKHSRICQETPSRADVILLKKHIASTL